MTRSVHAHGDQDAHAVSCISFLRTAVCVILRSGLPNQATTREFIHRQPKLKSSAHALFLYMCDAATALQDDEDDGDKPCSLCGRQYPHEHIRSVYTASLCDNDSDSDS